MARHPGSGSVHLQAADGAAAPAQGSDAGLEDSPGDRVPPPDLSGLPVAGLTRRRMLTVAVLLAVGWLAIAFLRQVGDVTAASARAEALASANGQLSGQIAALDSELRLIQRQEYIAIQARAHGLGAVGEVPFALQQPLASLPADAPGSAGLRVGAPDPGRTPLESWLTLLFGPAG